MKKLLQSLFRRAYLDRLSLALFKVFSSQVVFVAYHRVMNFGPDGAEKYPFDERLVSVGVDGFRSQMRYLKSQFEMVSLLDVRAAMRGEHVLPKQSLVVTFDDGYLDLYENTGPILDEMGIPAVVFVSSDLVSSTAEFWFDEVARVIRAGKPIASIPEIEFEGAPSRALGDSITIIDSLMPKLKRCSNRARENIVRMLVDSSKDRRRPESTEGVTQNSLMNWDQLRSLKSVGVEVQSHTRSHPILTSLDDDALADEIIGSKTAIERELNNEVYAMAYPNGTNLDYDDRVVAVCREAGYEIGITHERGISRGLAAAPFDIPRVWFDNSGNVDPLTFVFPDRF